MAPEKIAVGDQLTLVVDRQTRLNTMKNHTATHLLQAALTKVLGPQIKQSGSLVGADYLRFDFTHHKSITADELNKIEMLVNQKIMENIPVSTEQMTYKEATEKGVRAIFGEKYDPENVCAVLIGDFSAELCGGTHVKNTGEIGPFKITSSEALSAGVRRIVALTGPKAVELLQQNFDTVKMLSQKFKVQPGEVIGAVEKQEMELKEKEKALRTIRKELFKLQVPNWVNEVEKISDVPFGFVELTGVSGNELRDLRDLLLERKPALYFLTSKNHEKANVLVSLHKELENKLEINSLLEWLKTEGFKGGGSKGTLQGSIEKYDRSLKNKLTDWLEKQ